MDFYKDTDSEYLVFNSPFSKDIKVPDQTDLNESGLHPFNILVRSLLGSI